MTRTLVFVMSDLIGAILFARYAPSERSGGEEGPTRGIVTDERS